MCRERRNTELGVEVQCSRCQEFWPEDPEFFYFMNGAAHSWCKACYRGNEKVIAKNERWKAKQRKSDRPVIDDQFPCISLDQAVACMALEETTS